MSEDILYRRTDKLKNDNRIETLMEQKEFSGARVKLNKMIRDKEYNIEYIDYVEEHINKIEPHYQTITVNGEDVPVYFQTKGDGGT